MLSNDVFADADAVIYKITISSNRTCVTFLTIRIHSVIIRFSQIGNKSILKAFKNNFDQF